MIKFFYILAIVFFVSVVNICLYSPEAPLASPPGAIAMIFLALCAVSILVARQLQLSKNSPPEDN